MPIKTAKDRPKDAGSKLAWAVLVPLIAFVLILAAGVGLYVQQALARRAADQQRQQHNEQAGLPADYPSDIVPLYAGAQIVTTERGDAQSTDGEPMDKWYIHAQTTDAPQLLFDYYNALLLDQDFQQGYYTSIASNYGVSYANEDIEVQFVMEVRGDSDLTQLEITLYRLRK